MAELSDDLVEHMSDPDLFELYEYYLRFERWDYSDPGNCVWTTQMGERIRFADLQEGHRDNILRMLVRKYGPNQWDGPTGRALVACGISEKVREELGIPSSLPVLPTYFDTNQDKGIPR